MHIPFNKRPWFAIVSLLALPAVVIAVIMTLTTGAEIAYATASQGITQTLVATGIYPSFEMTAQYPVDDRPGNGLGRCENNGLDEPNEDGDIGHGDPNCGNWRAEVRTNGIDANITLQTSSAIPGADTGWHSHPGPLLVTVTQGDVTFYDATDPTCAGHVVTAGHGFVEQPNHVHTLRNEGTVVAKWTSVNIRPFNVPGRHDENAPSNCH